MQNNTQNISSILPVLAVEETVLMPNAGLPLCLKKEKYKHMQDEIVEGNVVAVLHPISGTKKKDNIYDQNSFYKTGCSGKIIHTITIGDRINILLQGICRFNIVHFIESTEGVVRVMVDYTKYAIDMNENNDKDVDTTNLLTALASYCKDIDAAPNWSEINSATTDSLVSALAMSYPLHPLERQSILEIVDLKERSDMITKLINMNLHGIGTANATFN